MCGTHSYELVQRDDDQQMEAMDVLGPHQFYVWDNVAIALHVGTEVLKFDPERLRKNLKFCQREMVKFGESSDFNTFEQAEGVVRGLWPGDASPLERA